MSYSEPKHYRTMPRVLRIGCYLFTVEVGEGGDHEAEGTFGHVNHITQKIRVRPGMTPQNLANTFIHETLHGIHWYLNAGNPDEEVQSVEENYTLLGANGLCQFAQDNPDAMRWWLRTLNTVVAA
jgi:hypothetical protein